MKVNDIYEHYKGVEYSFRGIALPISEVMDEGLLDKCGKVKHHETSEEIDLYFYNGLRVIKSDVPHVIYQSEKDYGTDVYWAREVDDFFGYVIFNDGSIKKRFKLKK